MYSNTLLSVKELDIIIVTINPAVMCPVLFVPENGVITYSEDSGSSQGFMETATYSCNTGFGLSSGDTVRTCVGAAGSSGEWTGTAPTCQGELTPLSEYF